jgi:hypothetical protein
MKEAFMIHEQDIEKSIRQGGTRPHPDSKQRERKKRECSG